MAQKLTTNTKIWLSSPHMGGSEKKFVDEAFDTNWIAPLGPNVEGFEKDLELRLGSGAHVAALSSGTGAIHLGLQLLGVKAGDSVICQSFTFAATANPICYLGANPVFVDSERDTWNMCPDLLLKAIENEIKKNNKPKAIVCVHLYGMPYKADVINKIARKYGIPVLEDAAEALGSSYWGTSCGLLADIGVFSFNGNKIITTSGGGALVVRTEDSKKEVVHLATQARDTAVHYQHSKIGFNYRLSNVLAGIGRGQMEVLDDRVDRRRYNFEYYKKAFTALGFQFLEEPEGMYSNRWLSCMLTASYEAREEIRLSLAEKNIESRPLWKPLHLQPVFANCVGYTNGVSEDLFERGLCLPSGSNLDDEDLDRVISCVKKTMSQ